MIERGPVFKTKFRKNPDGLEALLRYLVNDGGCQVLFTQSGTILVARVFLDHPGFGGGRV